MHSQWVMPMRHSLENSNPTGKTINKWIGATLALAALFLPINSGAITVEDSGGYVWEISINSGKATITKFKSEP